MGFSVGIGLTNECNLRCPHCYRPDMVIDRLTLQDVRRVCDSIPVRAMNLGGGETGLHPQYHAILEYLWGRGITTTVTSNGLSIEALTDEGVKRFHSVEFSLDFPTEQEQDAFRGRGHWRGAPGVGRAGAPPPSRSWPIDCAGGVVIESNVVRRLIGLRLEVILLPARTGRR